jgi:putative membrane protein
MLLLPAFIYPIHMKMKQAYRWAIWMGLWMAAPVGAAISVREQVQAQRVLSELHHSDQIEIQFGKMAQVKGTSIDIRAYGDRIVKDHQDADRQVKDLAKKDGIPLVAQNTSGWLNHFAESQERRFMSDLSRKSGTAFDKAFMDATIDDHKRDISNLESNENSMRQEDLHALLARLLPALEQHLEQAEKIQRGS